MAASTRSAGPPTLACGFSATCSIAATRSRVVGAPASVLAHGMRGAYSSTSASQAKGALEGANAAVPSSKSSNDVSAKATAIRAPPGPSRRSVVALAERASRISSVSRSSGSTRKSSRAASRRSAIVPTSGAATVARRRTSTFRRVASSPSPAMLAARRSHAARPVEASSPSATCSRARTASADALSARSAARARS